MGRIQKRFRVAQVRFFDKCRVVRNISSKRLGWVKKIRQEKQVRLGRKCCEGGLGPEVKEVERSTFSRNLAQEGFPQRRSFRQVKQEYGRRVEIFTKGFRIRRRGKNSQICVLGQKSLRKKIIFSRLLAESQGDECNIRDILEKLDANKKCVSITQFFQEIKN